MTSKEEAIKLVLKYSYFHRMENVSDSYIRWKEMQRAKILAKIQLERIYYFDKTNKKEEVKQEIEKL